MSPNYDVIFLIYGQFGAIQYSDQRFRAIQILGAWSVILIHFH